MRYHYANAQNTAVGPIEESELHELFKGGTIANETNIIAEGANDWKPYSSLLNRLTPPLNTPTPPALSAAPTPQQSIGHGQQCPYCSEVIVAGAKKCKHCGEIIDVVLRAAEEAKKGNSNQPMVFMNAGGGSSSSSSSSAVGGFGGQIIGTKSRVVAAILAFFLGFIGVHKFYLGQLGWGIIYLLFSWTFIPMFVGWLEGLLYLLSTERAFALKYG